MSPRVEAPDRLWQRSRPWALQLLLRVAVFASPLLAIVFIRIAGEPILVIELALVVLAFVCVAYPDSHVGLVTVALIGVDWLVAVDDATTPWAVAVAVAVATLHTSMAAASVAPIAARWTGAMRRRWARRFVVVAAASVPTWTAVAIVGRAELGSSRALLTTALLMLATAGVWARHGHMSVDAPQSAGSTGS